MVLTSGDFTNDPELKGRYMGAQEAKASGVNPTATGDGQKMAVKLGARILNGDLALGPELRFVPPSRGNLLTEIAAVAMARLVHGLVDRPYAGRAAAAVHHELRDHRAGAIARICSRPAPLLVNKNGERFTDERDNPALALPDQPDGGGFILLDARIAEQFTVWPHFISTAPGVAYALCRRLPAQPARRFCRRRDA